MIESDFGSSECAKGVRFSGGQFELIVEALDDAAAASIPRGIPDRCARPAADGKDQRHPGPPAGALDAAFDQHQLNRPPLRQSPGRRWCCAIKLRM